MADEPTGALRHQEQMLAQLATIADPRTAALVRALLTSLWRAAMQRRPAADLDLELFTRAAIDFCGKHELIAAILRGELDDPWDS